MPGWLVQAWIVCALLAVAANAMEARRSLGKNKHRNKNNKPKLTKVTLLNPPVKYQCTLAIQARAQIKAGQGMIFTQHSASDPELLITECSLRCITSSNDSTTCVGFVKDSEFGCKLAYSQDAPVVVQPLSAGGSDGFVSSTVLLEDNCYVAIVGSTEAPTTYPTPGPGSRSLSPTPLGTPSCSPWPDGVDPRLDEFFPVPTNRKLCEITQVAGLGVSYYKMSQFTCGLSTCISLCAYDQNCKYVLYSALKQVCYKSTKLQVTDAPERIVSYEADGWVAYARKSNMGGDPGIMYYSGFCANKVPGECKQFPQCGWNQGKRGANSYDMGGNAGGYCGRVSCTATSPVPTTIP